jgi:outer membrane PBP1 activator LpoA protein
MGSRLLSLPPPEVLAGLIINHPLLDFVLHMVIITLQQTIDEKISLLKELMNHKNKPQVNRTYQNQIDAIRAMDDYDLENVEAIIKQKKELLKNSEDIQETDRFLAELEALEWLQAQIVVFTLDNKDTASS